MMLSGFWAGVLITLLSEMSLGFIAIVISFAIHVSKKSKKNKL